MHGTNQIRKQRLREDGYLQVHEVFNTIQGEGPFAGYRAIFVRLTGCMLQCWWCFGIKAGRRVPKIIFAVGPNQRLDEVKEGDKLLTFDNDFNLVTTTVTHRLTRSVTEWYEIVIDDTTYFVTPEHPFFTARGLVRADALVVGDDIFTISPSEKISYKKLGDNNPMRRPDTAAKAMANRDHAAMGKAVAKSIKQKKANGTYVPTWFRLTKQQQERFRQVVSIANSGSRNGNWHQDHPQRNYLLLKREVRKGGYVCSACSGHKNLEVHHLDGNELNDAIDNLFVFCKSCHSKAHQRGYNFWAEGRRDGKRLVGALSHNGARVQSIQLKQNAASPLQVYNLSCAPYNSYLVDDMWVHNCDTEWDDANDNFISPEELVEKINAERFLIDKTLRSPFLVVLTGGEPLRQNVEPLIGLLVQARYHVQIETAGVYWVPAFDERRFPILNGSSLEPGCSIVCSPKTGNVNEKIAAHCRHWKYIIRRGEHDPTDGLPVKSTQHRPNTKAIPPIVKLYRPMPGPDNCIYVQPCDEGDEVANTEANIKAAVASAKNFGYRLSLQQHKIVGVP
jgi:organic radical activating enzyme/5-methylcytosine-specific restriction endonuclease McrA